jgi:diaminobutyrate acetyltransferase
MDSQTKVDAAYIDKIFPRKSDRKVSDFVLGRDAGDGVVMRDATLDDGAAMFELVKKAGVLDENSAYAYLMMADHFSETCVVAERNGEMIGFIIGFVPPSRPDTVFVWQIGVSPTARRMGLGKRMLNELIARDACDDVDYLEATVTPSNKASAALFRGFARSRSVPCAVSEGIPEDAFPGKGHECEHLFRIGPLDAAD